MKSSFWIILFAILTFEVSATAEIVKEIRIEGNKRIEKAAITQKIRTKVGSAFSKEIVQDDIRSLFSLNFFDNVEVYEDDKDGGVAVIFDVHERPIVSKIDYTGLSALDKDEMKDLVTFKTFEVLDIHKLNASIEKISNKYEEKGYFLADVRYDIKVNEKTNEAVVTFKIQENDKIQVKKINIIGANVVPADDLKKVMQTQEGGPLSFITGSGSYREAVFERDVQTLGFYYGTLGYVRARFGKPEVTVSPDKKFIYITFYVDEGQQYSVGNVEFSGELLYSRTELKEDSKLTTGDTFNTEILRRETLRYTERYSDLGYAFANVIPQPIIHDDTKRVDVTFEVDKGERVFIGTINVSGNTRTKDKVIRRELKIREGELFSGTRKRESREAVMRLGYFDNVEFHQSTSKSDPRVVDIEIKIKERSTGQLVIGAGYASGDIGFTAQAQLSQNNFLGNGQVASLSAQVLTGRSFYEFNLGFQEPYVGASNWSLGGDLYQLRRNVFATQAVNTFEETKTGFDVKLGHPVFEFTNLFLTYKIENSYVPTASIIDVTLIQPASVNGVTSSVAASVVYDHRDDRFDPREGWYANLSEEYAGLGGIRKYLRTKAGIKFFHPLFYDFIFRLNLAGSNISATTDQPVPQNELFIQGGLFSLRGYDYLSIGPKANLSPNSGDLSQAAIDNNLAGTQITVGGHSELLLQSEVEFPLLKEARIRGVIFFDAGNSFDKLGQDGPLFLANIGWGFRWFTPIGPLRFEFGYPIVNSGSPKFYFTIGPPF